MFFYVSKFLGFLATPSNAIALIGLVGFLFLFLNRSRVACCSRRCRIDRSNDYGIEAEEDAEGDQGGRFAYFFIGPYGD